MQPIQSYRIWFTPRSGSSLLCKGLEATEVAGKPGEFFTLFEYDSLCEKYQVDNYEALKYQLWREGTSSNGVFGMKIVLDHKVMCEIAQLRYGDPQRFNEPGLLDDLFPNCMDIYLSRRNKIRQVVSWWKAIKDSVWHIDSQQKKAWNGSSFYLENYDFAALQHLLKESVLRECAIEEYFNEHGIRPLIFIYEDMIKDFRTSVLSILKCLSVEAASEQFSEMYYQKTADSESEVWVQRLRADLQKEMIVKTW